MTDSASAKTPGHSVPEFVPRLIDALLQVTPEGGVLHEPEFSDTERDYVVECIETGWVSSVGKFVDRFEEMLCETTGAHFAVATVNGTAAMHTALHLAGVQPDEEVLVPAFGFIATANAVSQCAAIPHFVDVNEQTLAVDGPALERYLREALDLNDGIAVNRLTGRRVRALIVAHILGHPAEMEALLDVASRFSLTVVEDAAESLGAYRDGRHTGTFGLIGALSFNGNKTITTGGGGAVVTNDAAIGARAKHLTTTAKKPHAWEFDHDAIGFNYRMPNLNAALGCAQLEKLPDFLARKRVLAHRYRDALDGINEVTFACEPPGTVSSYWLNAILLTPDQESLRDDIHRLCHAAGIMTRSAWKPLSALAPYVHCPAMPVPVTESLYKRLIKLPSSPHLAGTGS
jgi:perosamine synthetase